MGPASEWPPPRRGDGRSCRRRHVVAIAAGGCASGSSKSASRGPSTTTTNFHGECARIARATGPSVIIDTDLSRWWDDATAIGLANVLQQQGAVNVLGIVSDVRNPVAVAAIDAIDTAYGHATSRSARSRTATPTRRRTATATCSRGDSRTPSATATTYRRPSPSTANCWPDNRTTASRSSSLGAYTNLAGLLGLTHRPGVGHREGQAARDHGRRSSRAASDRSPIRSSTSQRARPSWPAGPTRLRGPLRSRGSTASTGSPRGSAARCARRRRRTTRCGSSTRAVRVRTGPRRRLGRARRLLYAVGDVPQRVLGARPRWRGGHQRAGRIVMAGDISPPPRRLCARGRPDRAQPTHRAPAHAQCGVERGSRRILGRSVRAEPGRQCSRQLRVGEVSRPGDVSVGSDQHGRGRSDLAEDRELPRAVVAWRRPTGLDPPTERCRSRRVHRG